MRVKCVSSNCPKTWESFIKGLVVIHYLDQHQANLVFLPESEVALMVEDIESFKTGLTSKKIESTEIRIQEKSGHKIFDVKDPDGTLVSICSSHAGGRLV